MESLDPIGGAVLHLTHAMSTKDDVATITSVLEVLFADTIIAIKLDYLEVVGPFMMIVALVCLLFQFNRLHNYIGLIFLVFTW